MSLAIAKLLQFITANIPEMNILRLRKFTEFSNLNFDDLSFKNLNTFRYNTSKTNDKHVISYVRSN